jgi:hypothetical protein
VAYCATFNLEQDIYYVRVGPSAASMPLAIRSIVRDAKGVHIIFPSDATSTYRFDYGDTPGGSWHQLQTSIIGTGADITVSDATAMSTPTRFYRIVVLP